MKILKLLLVLIVLAAIGFGAGRLLTKGGKAPDGAGAHAAGAPAEMPPMPVPAIVLEEAPVQIWKEFPGRLEAVDSVELRAQVSGTINAIKFEDGQSVNKGDVLFVIDPRPYEAEVSQAKADLQAAKNQYDLAVKELKRAEELIGTGAIPKRTYDERLNTELVTKSAIASAEARLKRAQLNLDYAYVKAPISGRVSRAEITEGNLVEAGPNAPVLTTIVSSDGIYAGFEVDEQTYLRYLRGASSNREEEQKIPVRLALQSAPDIVYEGNIQSFDNKIDARSGTIRARAHFKNEDGALLPGMFVTVRIGSPQTKTAIVVPERAIGTDQDRKYVYIVGPENKVAYREVAPGESVNGSRIITSGLAAGEMVITDGVMKIHPDMVVAPQTDGPAAAEAPPAPAAAPEAIEAAPAEETPEKTEP
ncbi:MAG: efflux RND transporter periplasmic adaptor subunit [Alphaproteobacteria bacterium PRO2]|nr:efflux RND transporter periplasmic adaptor subunit [Alphaproteobacteria bacterium PRO2]